MLNIMVLTINESDDVQQSLFSILLANKKVDHGILRNLVEKVIGQCKEKLKCFLDNDEQENEEMVISEHSVGEIALMHEGCVSKH